MKHRRSGGAECTSAWVIHTAVGILARHNFSDSPPCACGIPVAHVQLDSYVSHTLSCLEAEIRKRIVATPEHRRPRRPHITWVVVRRRQSSGLFVHRCAHCHDRDILGPLVTCRGGLSFYNPNERRHGSVALVSGGPPSTIVLGLGVGMKAGTGGGGCSLTVSGNAAAGDTSESHFPLIRHVLRWCIRRRQHWTDARVIYTPHHPSLT